MRAFIATLFILFVLIIAADAPVWADTPNPQVEMQTSKGSIIIELDPVKAPLTTDNFLSYVKEGFYDGTIFHRVIAGFMIQGGGFTEDMAKKPTKKPISNEADNGLTNTPGTIAMARTQAPHSATSQFFINTKDNAFLNHKSKTIAGWGYCVFGRVVKGLDVVKAIENVQTGIKAGHRDVPIQPVVIQSVKLLPPTAQK